MPARPPPPEPRVVVDVVGPVRLALGSIAPSIPWVRGSGPIDGDQLVAHARDEKAAKAAVPVRDSERGVARAGKLAGRVDESLQHLVHGQVGGHREHRVTDRLQRRIEPLRHRSGTIDGRIASFTAVPRHWIWMQVAIVVFVLAGMVIAITKLA